MRPSELLSTLLLFSSAASAWPSPWDALKQDIAPLIRRQDQQTSFDLSFSGVQGNTATTVPTDTASSDDSKTTGDSKATGTGSDKTTGTGKQTGTATTGKSASGTQSSKTFDARLPAGGVSMITPNPMSTQYYKINNFVTFAWNYTSLSVTPTAIDILAKCSLNQATYTLALNQSVEATQTIVWDTGKYQATGTVPLLTETYTLIIHDANKDVTDTAQAGYLATYEQFTFGMYEPRPYTPIADYVCATCSSAMTAIEKQTMWAIFSMAGLTVMSFGWFTGVAGLW